MIRCFDPEPFSESEEAEQATSAGGNDSDATIEVQYRYRAYFVYGNYEATYSKCFSRAIVCRVRSFLCWPKTPG
jgi:hypothetical protein